MSYYLPVDHMSYCPSKPRCCHPKLHRHGIDRSQEILRFSQPAEQCRLQSNSKKCKFHRQIAPYHSSPNKQHYHCQELRMLNWYLQQVRRVSCSEGLRLMESVHFCGYLCHHLVVHFRCIPSTFRFRFLESHNWSRRQDLQQRQFDSVAVGLV